MPDPLPRFVFFTGKGGVGKTALACATAIRLADAGHRVLLVSTDPASNLSEMLGAPVSSQPTPIPGVDRLAALDIDPEQAANAYRERVIAPYRPLWTDAQVAELREQLAGACTTEIAAFDQFTELLSGDAAAVPFDHVLFDTAPTGHTLRLLRLPRAWTAFLAAAPQGASCLGPHSGLKSQQAQFAQALAALCDPQRTAVVLVARPDLAALREAARTADELVALGLRSQRLVINGVFRATDATDPVAIALERRGREALDARPAPLRALPVSEIPLRPFNLVGIRALRALDDDDAARALARDLPAADPPDLGPLPPLSALVDELAAPGRGLILVMGKGGVGKTTLAAAIAADLAHRGHTVHLSTTDPAAHLAATLAGELPHLTQSRIDPAVETQAYVQRVLATRGATLDAAARALLAEDLRSPCYEEVAVFAAFARVVNQARAQFVVLDTAPTGHTLLLLDAAGTYHRQLQTAEANLHLTTPLMKLRDPEYTRILLVTLAEPTPVSEAGRLQQDLLRAGISPYAWIVNASLARSADPGLRRRIAAEHAQIDHIHRQYARHLFLVPWAADPPVGVAALLALASGRVPGEAPGSAPSEVGPSPSVVAARRPA
jgi:arsenite-transporting ATPase